MKFSWRAAKTTDGTASAKAGGKTGKVGQGGWLPWPRKAAADGGRVPLAKIAVKRIAVPVNEATPEQRRAAAARPVVGTHVPAQDKARAGSGMPGGSRLRRGTVGQLEDDLSGLSDEEFMRSRLDDEPPFEVSRSDAHAAPALAVRKAQVKGDMGRFVRGDEQYLVGVKEAQLVDSSPHAMWALYLLVIAVVSGLTWAALAKVDIITRAEGKVVPEAREQVIASLEGGILRALHVREGALVEVGEDLVQLDPTRFAAQQNEGQAKLIGLKGTVARLTAEAYGRALVFPPDVRVEAAVVAAETEAYNARRRSLDEAITVTRRSMVLLDSELDTAQRMSAQGLMSDVEVMRLRRQRNDMVLQIQERSNRFRQDASTELTKVRGELAQIDEQQVVKEDALKRTTLKSPVRGIVKNVRFGTVGGVITAGAPILEIVPLGERVLVEARIKPADIGFVRVGQPVEAKLTAYDYSTYGGLKGTIEYISPDALGDEQRPGTPDATYYRARIRTDSSKLLGRNNTPLQVLPGMTASVEVRTGDRTVMQFMLKPLLKSREAFTEH